MPPSVLGDLDPETFLRDYWQKKPLLVRGALPGFQGFLDKEAILARCQHPETPSRLVVRADDGLHVHEGPFEVDAQDLPDRDWTVLVQSLETVFDEGWALLDRFSFLPRARIDDLMVSFAVPGGGVGPHLDLYDVFLVQGVGTRLWRIADRPVEGGGDIPGTLVLDDFEPDQEIEVGPGDLLYLPPLLPHDGIALTPCTTWSIGGAAPTHDALVGEFLAFLAQTQERAGVFSDPGLLPATRRGGLEGLLVDATEQLLQGVRWERPLIEVFLGRLLTGPKPHTVFLPPEDELDVEAFAARLAGPGELRLTPPTRMLHDEGTTVFVNGEALELPESDASRLRELADGRCLPLPVELSDDVIEELWSWLAEGWLRVA